MAAAPARHRSSAGPLAAAFVALVVYATLYPFDGWRWPPGHTLSQLMTLPWPSLHFPFDITANLLGYLLLGALLYGAAVRHGAAEAPAVAGATLGAAVLSYGLEVVQHFLPGRVPSLLDWVLNASGALIGVFAAAMLDRAGALGRWQALRDRWFIDRSAGARVLLLLWPLGLLFPTPVALGVGQFGDKLRALVEAALEGTPWAEAASVWLAAPAPTQPLSPFAEGTAVALGLLAPVLVAYTASRPGWRRALLALGAAALAVAAMTLSTALNFGPDHALAWLTPVTVSALTLGAVVAVLGAPLGRRLAAGLGLVVMSALIALVAEAPSNAYYTQSLQAWEQGRFIRFHGLARWVGWLWPYAAMAWLLLRLGSRERGDS